MSKLPLITAASAPDVEQIRNWLLSMIHEMRFADLVSAVIALVVRLRDLNTELTKRVTGRVG